jgi:hypothetical protein
MNHPLFAGNGRFSTSFFAGAAAPAPARGVGTPRTPTKPEGCAWIEFAESCVRREEDEMGLWA